MDAGSIVHAAGDVQAGESRPDLVFRALFNRLSMRLALGVLVLTFVLPPDGAGIPLCWFEGLYGLPCPGCGMTRSLTSITHLHFGEAFGYHPFGFVVWLLVVVLAVAGFAGEARRRRVGEWLARRRAWAARVYLGFVMSFVAFGVVRMIVTALGLGVFEG
jgi:hypothetical protein